MEGSRVFVAFLRRIDIVTFKRALVLDNAQNVYAQNNIDIETYRWKSIGELHLCCGFYSPYARQSVDLLKSVTAHFAGCRVLFVCTYSEAPMYEQCQLPPHYTICSSVERLEQELGEELTPAQRTLLVQRVLPMTPVAAEPAVFVPQGGGVIFNFFGQRSILDAITQVMEEHMYEVDPDEIQDAINQSMQVQERPREDIRKRKRKEHPWTRIFKEPIPLRDEEEQENACVVCYANYATIQFVDAAGECDHVVMCDACAAIIMDDTRKCPVCRAHALTVRRKEPKE